MARARRAPRTRRNPVPGGRAARRQASEVRRARLALVVAAVASVVVLGAWFPASSLLHQHAALAATTSRLIQLRQEDRALAREHRLLASPAEIARIAREQYQLVTPGQRAYEVLPPNGSGGASAPYPGDPGNQPVAAPSGTAELPAGSAPTTTVPSAAGGGRPDATSGSGAGAPGLLARIVRTLEFWR